MQKIIISDGITTIDNGAFINSWYLTNVTFPQSLTSIGANVFYRCEHLNLTDTTLPEGLTSIGEKAFYDCFYLGNINIPSTVNSIGANAFTIHSNENSSSDPDPYFYNIYVDKNNNTYSSIDGVLFNKDGSTLICYPCGRYDEDTYYIPDSTKTIGEYAFSGAYYLKNVIITDNVIEIDDNAFNRCEDLESIIIPQSVTIYGDGIFYSCENLNNVSLPNNLENIPSQMFSYCSGLSNITIPNSVEEIGNSAFSNTGITSIYIPSSVRYIYNNAFSSSNGENKLTIINIYKPENSIEGAPWGADNATVNWLGQ